MKIFKFFSLLLLTSIFATSCSGPGVPDDLIEPGTFKSINSKSDDEAFILHLEQTYKNTYHVYIEDNLSIYRGFEIELDASGTDNRLNITRKDVKTPYFMSITIDGEFIFVGDRMIGEMTYRLPGNSVLNTISYELVRI